MRYNLNCLAVVVLLTSTVFGQQFTNTSLEGPAAMATAPPGWQQVPETYVNSQATGWIQATSDLLTATGPYISMGLLGNPNSGLSLQSGVYSENSSGTAMYHEGLRQTVSGFTVGQSYTVEFFQCVKRTTYAADQTGGWEVFIGNTSVYVSAPSFSNLPFSTLSLIWEQRSFSFTATASNLSFNFLPKDDDNSQVFNQPNGALRMAIDDINILTPLSIELDEFKCSVIQKQVQLDWTTRTEKNNDFFTVERTKDGIIWEAIAILDGAGSSLSSLTYAFTDVEPHYGTSYYRLKQTNFNGTSTYSKVKSAHIKFEYEIAPNPTWDYVKIKYRDNVEQNLSLQIYSPTGKLLNDAVGQSIDGSSTIRLPEETGIYLLIITIGEEHYHERIVKL